MTELHDLVQKQTSAFSVCQKKFASVKVLRLEASIRQKMFGETLGDIL